MWLRAILAWYSSYEPYSLILENHTVYEPHATSKAGFLPKEELEAEMLHIISEPERAGFWALWDFEFLQTRLWKSP